MYFYILNFAIVFSIALLLIRFFHANNSYEKILCFYMFFSLFIVLFINISNVDFNEIFDIIIILFLLKLISVLFLLYNRKKI
jgi:hypothetical protein